MTPPATHDPGDRPARQNKDLNRRVGALLIDRVLRVLGQAARLGEFHTRTSVETFQDVIGREPFSLDDESEFIDLAGLDVPPALHGLALLNGDWRILQFDRRVDDMLHLIVDASRSMRFPVRRIYAHPDGWDFADKDEVVRWSKPSLAKLVAGVFGLAAARSGFRVRIHHFGAHDTGWHGLSEEKTIRSAHDLLPTLFSRLDQRLARATRNPRPRSTTYEDLLAYLRRLPRGHFAIVGDWLDPIAPGEEGRGWRGDRARWNRLIEGFAQWSRDRPVAFVRVNHEYEVADPPARPAGEGPDCWGDSCLGPVEARTDDPDYSPEDGRVHKRRLEDQREWRDRLRAVLRPAARVWIEADNRSFQRHDRDPVLERALVRGWERLATGR